MHETQRDPIVKKTMGLKCRLRTIYTLHQTFIQKGIWKWLSSGVRTVQYVCVLSQMIEKRQRRVRERPEIKRKRRGEVAGG